MRGWYDLVGLFGCLSMIAHGELDERWVDVEWKFCENYQVSNLGRVRSLPRTYAMGYGHRGLMNNAGHVLKASLIKDYLKISMGTTKANRRNYSLKKVVYEHFVGPLELGWVLVCKDGDEYNAEVSNLEPISRAELFARNMRKVNA